MTLAENCKHTKVWWTSQEGTGLLYEESYVGGS